MALGSIADTSAKIEFFAFTSLKYDPREGLVVAFPVFLMPTTASPTASQTAAIVRSAITAETANPSASGAIHTLDGGQVKVDGDYMNFSVDRLSPSVCRLIFNAALKSNSAVDRAGSDVTPLKMRGAVGATKYIPMKAETIASPTDLCVRLGHDMADWNKSISEGQQVGLLGPEGQPLEPPADPGTEPRLTKDVSGVYAHCSESLKSWPGKVVRSVFSINPKFGVVWRADILMRDDPKPSFRQICWRIKGVDGKENYPILFRPFEMFDPKQSVGPLVQ